MTDYEKLLEEANRLDAETGRLTGGTGLPDDWWTTDLEDEPCDGCGTRPSKHAGHGSFTCQRCYEARWCPACHYEKHDGACPSAEERARREQESRITMLLIADIDDRDNWLRIAVPLIPRLAAALREVMAERDEARSDRDGLRAALATETRNANVYAHERDTMRSERDACSRAHEAAEARLVVVERERDTALADVEAMRADWTRAVDDIAAFLESCDDSRDDPMAYAAMEVRRRWARALDARATPPSSHRCPGCNAAHRGEYDHCETCRARIAAPSGGKGRDCGVHVPYDAAGPSVDAPASREGGR